ncbi:TetR/AcrR family transcriptional regulator, partial [Kineococcus indalonis]|uniref:TetR/AcrR family transcriptional regulator n=1 Tax=Kineococcus indalonis TaxID=2696566 RepID=UPI0014133CDF
PVAGGERERLLGLVAAHVLEHGVTSLTLRGVAGAVGSNNRMLLYYFGSKEALVGEALRAVGEERFPGFATAWSALERGRGPLRQDLQRVWSAIAAPEHLPFLRLFFEVFGQAARGDERWRGVLGDIGDWQRPAAVRFAREGLAPRVAQARATELVALWRGLQMTLLITGAGGAAERERRRAVEEVQRAALDAFCARLPGAAGPVAGEG